MLQNIRDNIQGIMAKVIIGLMIIPFVFFGVESLVGGDGQIKVAEVNGEKVTEFELQQAIQLQRRQLINNMRDNLDPALLDENRLRGPALEQLLERKLLEQAAQDSGLGVSEVFVDQAILSTPAFQDNGVFSELLYQNVLSTSGFTSSMFKKLMQSDMLTQQINSGFAGSDFVIEKELAAIANIAGQQRSYRYLTIALDKVMSDVNIPAKAIDTYYQENPEQFKTEEKVKLAYIKIEPSDFYKEVSEDEIREAYELDSQGYEAAEERKVSHILIEITDERNEDEARSVIADIAAKLEGGESFAELAKTFSDDAGSAAFGGDLGFTQGDTFPEEFEEALFALELNQVSAPVQTDSGFHLVQATEISTGEIPSYEESKATIKERLQLASAKSDFINTVEDLKDLVFNSEDLQSPAKELNLTVSQSGWVSRSTAEDPLNNAQVIAAAFSDEVLKEGNNSDVLELQDEQMIVVRVIEHQASTVKALDVVKSDILTILETQQAIDLATEKANKVIADLTTKPLEDIARENNYPWQVQQDAKRNTAVLDREVLNFVFTMPELTGTANAKVFTLQNGNTVVVTLESVIAGKLADFNSLEQEGLTAEIRRNYSFQSINNYMTTLRSSSDIDVL